MFNYEKFMHYKEINKFQQLTYSYTLNNNNRYTLVQRAFHLFINSYLFTFNNGRGGRMVKNGNLSKWLWGDM